MARKQDKGGSPWTAPFWERAVAALGALFILVLLSYLLWQAFSGAQGPPDIVVEVDEISVVEAGWLVSFRARNLGGETAANVQIRGELLGEDGPLESASLTIDYIPPQSMREGGLFFSRDPRRHRMDLRPAAYAKP